MKLPYSCVMDSAMPGLKGSGSMSCRLCWCRSNVSTIDMAWRSSMAPRVGVGKPQHNGASLRHETA